MLNESNHITIGVKTDHDVLRVLCTLNNAGEDLTVKQFDDLVWRTVTYYRDIGIYANAYSRQDADNFVALDKFETPLDLDSVDLPIFMHPQQLDCSVAYELGDMEIKLTGFTAEQLEDAKHRAQQKCLLIWTIEDVNQQALDDDVEVFTTDQAMLVLQKIKTDHDAGVGCNWDVVSSLIGQVVG